MDHQTLRRRRAIVVGIAAGLLAVPHMVSAQTTIVRPTEIDDVLVNPGMGIETFQRFQGHSRSPSAMRSYHWTRISGAGCQAMPYTKTQSPCLGSLRRGGTRYASGCSIQPRGSLPFNWPLQAGSLVDGISSARSSCTEIEPMRRAPVRYLAGRSFTIR